MALRPILIAALACSTATATHASPRTDPTTGRAVFTGATSSNPTSIVLNPAAIGAGTFDAVYFAFSGTLDRTGIRSDTLDIGTGDVTPGDRITATALGPGGTVAYVNHIGERGTFGLQFHTPPPESFPADHAQLRYHTLGGGQRNWNVTAGGAVRFTSGLYFGASISHDNTFLRMKYALDGALATGIDSDCGGAPCGVGNPLASETYDVRLRSDAVATTNLKVNVGILARVYRGVWLAIAYHTPPGFDIQSTLKGSMDVTRAPRDGGTLLRGDGTVYVHFPASIDFELRAPLPNELEVHVGGRWEDLSRLQAYDVRGYGSTFRANGVPEWVERPRGFHDSFALWAGVEQTDLGRDGFLVGGRIGVETSALDDRDTSPLTVSPASVTLDVGVQYRVTRNWRMQLSYGAQIFPAFAVKASGFDPRFQLACAASGHDYDTAACAAVRNGYGTPTAAGEYSRLQHAMRFGVHYE
ncbi:MAG: hypothetical protein KIT31_40530, partial [Deltaproteobacteria bacterium]|nr:hypothetical protein [Deltaproteobacteria bacterium]